MTDWLLWMAFFIAEHFVGDAPVWLHLLAYACF